jgi:hypothetical protein
MMGHHEEDHDDPQRVDITQAIGFCCGKPNGTASSSGFMYALLVRAAYRPFRIAPYGSWRLEASTPRFRPSAFLASNLFGALIGVNKAKHLARPFNHSDQVGWPGAIVQYSSVPFRSATPGPLGRGASSRPMQSKPTLRLRCDKFPPAGAEQ